MTYIKIRVDLATIEAPIYHDPAAARRELRARYGYPCTIGHREVHAGGSAWQLVRFRFRRKSEALMFMLKHDGELA